MTLVRRTGSIKKARDLVRRNRAIDLRIAGHTWDAIAKECGYSSRGQANNDVMGELRRRGEEEKEHLSELREVEVMRLEGLWQKAWAMTEVTTPLVSHGKVIYEEDPITGDRVAVIDHGAQLAAIDRCVRISERKAKLLGVDSATQVEHSGVVRYEIVGLTAEDIGQVQIENEGHTPLPELAAVEALEEEAASYGDPEMEIEDLVPDGVHE